jgi:hypothetical protein
LQAGASGKGADTTRTTSKAMPPGDPAQTPTFITALSDAYLVPRDDLYAVFWRTADRDLCRVEPEVAEEALRGDGGVVRLGSWSGTIRGREDDWTLWWSGGVPWVASSDVDDRDQTLRLIERWRADAARAQARGQRWDPAPLADAPPAETDETTVRSVLGGLRALLARR